MYKALEKIAVITIPIAPVIFFGWRVYTEVQATTDRLWLSIPAGVLTAVGLEIVGMLAGRSAVEYWRMGNLKVATVPALIMVAYVFIGVWELRGTIGAIVFLIAPLVYILIALGQMLEAEHEKESEVALRVANEQKEDKAHQRRMEIAKLKLTHEEKKQRQALKAKFGARQKGTVAKTVNGTDWRTLPDSDKAELQKLTVEEIIDRYQVSRKTAHRWRKKVGTIVHQNGVVK